MQKDTVGKIIKEPDTKLVRKVRKRRQNQETKLVRSRRETRNVSNGHILDKKKKRIMNGWTNKSTKKVKNSKRSVN